MKAVKNTTYGEQAHQQHTDEVNLRQHRKSDRKTAAAQQENCSEQDG